MLGAESRIAALQKGFLLEIEGHERHRHQFRPYLCLLDDLADSALINYAASRAYPTIKEPAHITTSRVSLWEEVTDTHSMTIRCG